MKYARIRLSDGQERTAVNHDGLWFPYTDGVELMDVVSGLGDLDESFGAIAETDAEYLAPLRPGKILCVGRNYAEHAAELGNDVPVSPLIFTKFATSVIGHKDSIEWSTDLTQQVDWEGELVVIIGKPTRHISEADAMDAVFAYTIANDVSARDIQTAEKQWTRAKGMDTFCPLGPVVVSADEIADVQNLSIQTRVNDELMQDSNTKQMIFQVAYLISYLSQTFTLEAGDIILTGTPSGVGKAQTPPQFLQDGDTVSVTIEGIGTLTNTCVAME